MKSRWLDLAEIAANRFAKLVDVQLNKLKFRYLTIVHRISIITFVK